MYFLIQRLVIGSLVLFAALPARAEMEQTPHEKLMQLAKTSMAALAAEPQLVQAVTAQNAAHAAYTPARIAQLDLQWRQEVAAGRGQLSDGILYNPLSRYLTQLRDSSKGVFAEIIVSDNKGLNVGISNLTSDYWQGDEPKWQKSFGAGPDAVVIEDEATDESSGGFASQVSIPILDPQTRTPLGALTISVDLEKL